MKTYLFALIFLAYFSILAQDVPQVAPPVAPPIVSAETVILPPPAAPVEFVQVEAAPWDAPQWLKDTMLKAHTIPVVGPFLVEAIKWLGVIASVLTALATAFFAVAKTLSKTFQLVKLVGIATKIDAFYVKFSPYLKFFSMYNVQKGEIKKDVV
jgi:hypothetical protein